MTTYAKEATLYMLYDIEVLSTQPDAGLTEEELNSDEIIDDMLLTPADEPDPETRLMFGTNDRY